MELKCKKCNYSLSDDAAFCFNCGEKIVWESYCAQCHRELPVESKFCGFCGRAVETTSSDYLKNTSSSQKSLATEEASEHAVLVESQPTRQPAANGNSNDKVEIIASIIFVIIAGIFAVKLFLIPNLSDFSAEPVATGDFVLHVSENPSLTIGDTEVYVVRAGRGYANYTDMTIQLEWRLRLTPSVDLDTNPDVKESMMTSWFSDITHDGNPVNCEVWYEDERNSIIYNITVIADYYSTENLVCTTNDGVRILIEPMLT